MRSDAEEGVAKSCKWRKMEENCEKITKIEEKMNGKLRKAKEIEETVGEMRKLQEGNFGKTVGTQEKVWKKGMKWRQGKALEKLGT